MLVQDTKSDKTKEKALKEKEDFLEECLSLYCRIGIHLYGQVYCETSRYFEMISHY